MTIFLIYTLKVSACITAFYLLYLLLLKRYTFFSLNRFYLLAGMALSFIIPSVDLPVLELSPQIQSNEVFTAITAIEWHDYFQPQQIANEENTIDYTMIWPVVYITGLSLLFFRLLLSIVRMVRIKNKAEVQLMGKIKVMRTEGTLAFSFFNLVFLPKDEHDPMVMAHETAHVRQFHWFDLLLAEVTTLLLWYNPVVVWYKRSLKLQHEYLADASVVKSNPAIENYLNCMLRQVSRGSSSGLVSPFNSITIKKRIMMMTNKKTSLKYAGVYLFIIPLVSLLLFGFSDSRLAEKAFSVVSYHSAEFDIDTATKADIPSVWPVDKEYMKIASGYGMRKHPKTGEMKMHLGIDMPIPEGENIYATADGVVAGSTLDKRYGNYILIKHTDAYSTHYSHMKELSTLKYGDKVKKGQVIGYVGSSGWSTVPHLHYEVHKEGKRVDPEGYLP